jgi:hypothetical protein
LDKETFKAIYELFNVTINQKYVFKTNGTIWKEIGGIPIWSSVSRNTGEVLLHGIENEFHPNIIKIGTELYYCEIY